MEVFLHNLPPDLSKDGLKYQLAPFVRALAILDWSCEKPRKKRIPCILQEEQPRPGRLHPSTPGPRSTGASQANPSHRRARKLRPFSMLGTSCGYTRFDSGEFAFVPEVGWPRARGSVTFKRRNIIAELGDGRIIRIPLNTVFEVVLVSLSPRLMFHRSFAAKTILISVSLPLETRTLITLANVLYMSSEFPQSTSKLRWINLPSGIWLSFVIAITRYIAMQSGCRASWSF